ncbi:hypothetical protein ELY21_02255 [Legionella sp. km535]|nr:hypothetical protein ELY21_02255 [Legionella sp. km535]
MTGNKPLLTRRDVTARRTLACASWYINSNSNNMSRAKSRDTLSPRICKHIQLTGDWLPFLTQK